MHYISLSQSLVGLYELDIQINQNPPMKMLIRVSFYYLEHPRSLSQGIRTVLHAAAWCNSPLNAPFEGCRPQISKRCVIQGAIPACSDQSAASEVTKGRALKLWECTLVAKPEMYFYYNKWISQNKGTGDAAGDRRDFLLRPVTWVRPSKARFGFINLPSPSTWCPHTLHNR